MKALYMLTLGALCFIPTIAGTVAASSDGASSVTVAYASVDSSVAPLALLKAQASANAMLSRPL